MSILQAIRTELFTLQDAAYRDFQSRLLPTIAKERIIGVRIPALRKLATKWGNHPSIHRFLADLPHTYYDENMLHALILAQMQDYAVCIDAVRHFLPYIDNWAVCDSLRPKCFSRCREDLLKDIRTWMDSDQPYTIRFGLEMLMLHFLGEAFRPEFLTWAAAIRSEAYYVNMMLAWFFAEALAKQYAQALPYLTRHRLPVWVHNKTIQKATESYKITAEQKIYLRLLKRKSD